MRKNYKTAGMACLGLMLSLTNINAQTQSDFENLTLSSDTFWDGSDMSGFHNSGKFESSFIDGTAIYQNVYDTSFGAAFGYWSTGFAYTNKTDSVTSGSGNLFSARAGSGQGGSPNYAVSNNKSTIVLTGAAINNEVNGVHITNGTYAANSMRDGDSFAKKFGGASGNDADWFLLTIKGYTGGNLTNDSVNFYLADYRFTNNAQDYIVNDWQWVDLTSLGNIDSVYFELSSSDVGSFGMNTPAFFCLDNFNDQTVAIDEELMSADFKMYPNPTNGTIFINTNEVIDLLELIDLTGKTVMDKVNMSAGTHSISLGDLNSGVYFVRISSNHKTTVKRLVKY